MKTIKFVRSVLFDEGGVEVDIYRSDDFPGEYTSERACILAVLAQEYFIADLNLLTIRALDLLALDAGIYVMFEEEYESQ